MFIVPVKLWLPFVCPHFQIQFPNSSRQKKRVARSFCLVQHQNTLNTDGPGRALFWHSHDRLVPNVIFSSPNAQKLLSYQWTKKLKKEEHFCEHQSACANSWQWSKCMTPNGIQIVPRVCWLIGWILICKQQRQPFFSDLRNKSLGEKIKTHHHADLVDLISIGICWAPDFSKGCILTHLSQAWNWISHISCSKAEHQKAAKQKKAQPWN